MSEMKKEQTIFNDGLGQLEDQRTKENPFLSELIQTAKDLFYISETDAEIAAFSGRRANEVSIREVLNQTGIKSDAIFEEIEFDKFFNKLTGIKDWFGKDDILRANRFKQLRVLLKENLDGLKVFRIGRIRIEIVVAGLDRDKLLCGIRTFTVET